MFILFAILIFSFLIFIHELGHFVTAKLSGVQVNEFAMFMGPAIFKKKVGETLYSIRCIPFGGYCAMEGEDGGSDNPRSFHSTAWWKRLIILVAGSAMNFISGFVILAILLSCLGAVTLPVISSMEEGSLVGGENGLQVGDEILKVDGYRVYAQSDFSMILYLHPGEVHDVTVRRDGKTVELEDFTMKMAEFSNGDGTTTLRYGFSFTNAPISVGTVLRQAWRECLSIIQQVFMSLEMLLTGQLGLQDMSGPVGIVDMMAQVGAQSETTLLAVLNVLNIGAFLAVNLAVMNMLPIPALDGGRVLFLLLTTAYEAVFRKKLNPKYEALVNGIGMIVLLGLMAVILFKDIFTIVGG